MGIKDISVTEAYKTAPFSELVDADLFPVLARAAKDTRAAQDTRVEWLVDTLDPEGVRTERWVNYQQIFRLAFRESDDRIQKSHEFFNQIENVLIGGIPYRPDSWRGSIAYTTCGGYRHYLNRELNDGDHLRLEPLREPMLRRYEQGPDSYGNIIWYDDPKMEWLAETSLVVIPG